MSDFEVKFDVDKAIVQLERIERKAAAIAHQEIRWLGANIISDLIKATPPTTGNAVFGGETYASQLSKAEKRIDREISQLFFTIDRPAVSEKGGWVKLFKSKNNVFLTPSNLYIYKSGDDLSNLSEIHKRHYKRGRFRKPNAPVRKFQKRSYVVRQYVVSDRAAKNYSRRLKSKLGIAKSGFGKAAGNLQINLPSWISRHGANGMYREHKSEDGFQIVFRNPFVYAWQSIRRAEWFLKTKWETIWKHRLDSKLSNMRELRE